MDEVWTSIVAEALDAGLKGSGGPVPGAKLRELIVKTALRRGLQFPPAGHEQESFGDFLKYFGSTVLVRRRTGKDLLTAPVTRPELIAAIDQSDGTRLREDIFEAFTRIPRGLEAAEPWYAPSRDAIDWLRLTELSEDATLIKIPPATIEQERSDRKSFVQSADISDEIKPQLAEGLDAHSGLSFFSNRIKAHGLSQQWHLYRFRAVVRRIQAWCASSGVQWREEWISSGTLSQARLHSGTRLTGKNQRQLFERLADSLSDEDLRRIAVPLDLVLKVIQG